MFVTPVCEMCWDSGLGQILNVDPQNRPARTGQRPIAPPILALLGIHLMLRPIDLDHQTRARQGNGEIDALAIELFS